jgi:hypothetical protein
MKLGRHDASKECPTSRLNKSGRHDGNGQPGPPSYACIPHDDNGHHMKGIILRLEDCRVAVRDKADI